MMIMHTHLFVDLHRQRLVGVFVLNHEVGGTLQTRHFYPLTS